MASRKRLDELLKLASEAHQEDSSRPLTEVESFVSDLGIEPGPDRVDIDVILAHYVIWRDGEPCITKITLAKALAKLIGRSFPVGRKVVGHPGRKRDITVFAVKAGIFPPYKEFRYKMWATLRDATKKNLWIRKKKASAAGK